MKKLLLIALMSAATNVNAQNEVWFESDTYKKIELLGDTKGTNILVDVTCTGVSLAEVTTKAEKIALYQYIFIGLTGASPIAKLADNSVYNQDKDFFISFLNNKSEGLQFATGTHNKAKPISEVAGPSGKKKDVLVKATISVDLNIDEIRKNLEGKGKIKSAANIKESIGEITVVVKPDDRWLSRMRGIQEENNQDKKQIIKDYSIVKNDKRYNEVVAAISSKLGEYFKIDDISNQLNNSNDESLRDNLGGDVELQESPEDLMARTLQADIVLEVAFESDNKLGKELTEFSITLTGIDAYTNSRSEMSGTTVRKSISSDDFNSLLDAAMKTACDEFKSKALGFLVKRDETGISGKVICKVESSVVNFNSKITLTDGSKLPFSQLVDEALDEIAKKSNTFGTQTSTRREYDVKIPSKTKNRKGKEVSNDFEKFSLEVEKYISENFKDVQALVKPVGKGKVVVIFKPAE